MIITDITETHYPEVKRIYLEGIATGNATFETEAPGWEKWDKTHLQHSRLLAREGEGILGWAALSPVSGRCVYDGVAEVSIYIAAEHRAKGIGKLLMQQLILSSEANNIWTLQAGLFPENEASLALHQMNGFRVFGKREKIGKMKDTWRDTILLERRSKITGV
jgi:L-amino acid N-acyltransferase YncA